MDRRKAFVSIVLFILWSALVAINKIEYEIGGMFNDPTILWGMIFIVIYLEGERWYVYGKAVSQRAITAVDSFSVRTTEILFRIKGNHVYKDYVVIPRWSCRIPGVDISPPGGRMRGYVVVPEELYEKFGKDVIINCSDLQCYVGTPNDNPDGLTHYDLPKIIRAGLYNTLKGKRDGYSFEYPIYYGEEQYVAIDKIVYAKVDYKERDIYLNNQIARLEQQIFNMQKEESYNQRKNMGQKKQIFKLLNSEKEDNDGMNYDRT